MKNFDKFYTKPETVNKILIKIKEYDWYYNKITQIIEPSAGCGAFSNKIENCFPLDIKPDNENIIEHNFLGSGNIIQKDENTKNLIPRQHRLIIGNPPFGRQSSLAIEYFKVSSHIANYICFVLPKSFKKVSVQNKVPLTHSLIYSEDLPDNSFHLPDETDYDVPCCFQIWIKKDRKKVLLPTNHDDFEFIKKDKIKNLDSDEVVAIRRVGYYAGRLEIDANEILDLSASTNYFIQLNISKNDFINIYNKINLKDIVENTVGARSLAKGELIEEYSKILN